MHRHEKRRPRDRKLTEHEAEHDAAARTVDWDSDLGEARCQKSMPDSGATRPRSGVVPHFSDAPKKLNIIFGLETGEADAHARIRAVEDK